MMKKILVVYFLFVLNLLGQEIKIVQLINADSLVGRVLNNENIRILNGNVQFLHEDIRIYCDRAIQFIQSNRVELEGNIQIIQGNTLLKTPKGSYLGNKKVAVGSNGITLNDGKITLVADSGEYFFSKKEAMFKGNVKLFDDTTTLTADKLIYFTEKELANAYENVTITQNLNHIFADSLYFYRKDNFTLAFGNVITYNENDNLKIFSDYLENDQQKKHSLVSGQPILIQIDTTSEGKVDTLIIHAKKMEAYRDTEDIYYAFDSVKVWRNEFRAISPYILYKKSEGKMFTSKTNNFQPLFWYNESLAYGDSVEIFVENNRVKKARLFYNSFLISMDTLSRNRFNQMNGNFIELNFDEKSLISVLVNGNSLGIYYLYDNDEPNGLNKASSDSALIFFEDNKVSEIKLFGNPEGEYHPEELIIGKENDFILTGFKWIKEKPEKDELFRLRNNLINNSHNN